MPSRTLFRSIRFLGVSLLLAAFWFPSTQVHAGYATARKMDSGWEISTPRYVVWLNNEGQLRQIRAEHRVPILEETIDGSKGIYFLVGGAPLSLKVHREGDDVWVAEQEGYWVRYSFGWGHVMIEVKQTVRDDIPFRIALTEKTRMAMIPDRDTQWHQAPIRGSTDECHVRFDTFMLAIKGLTSVWPSGNGIQVCETATRKDHLHVVTLEFDFPELKSDTDSLFSVSAYPGTVEGAFGKGENPRVQVQIENHREKAVSLQLTGVTVPYNRDNTSRDEVSTSVLVQGETTRSFPVELPAQKPGFYDFEFRIDPGKEARADAGKGEMGTVPYSVTFGYDVLSIPDSVGPKPPPDLRAFWDKTLAALSEVEPKYKVVPVPDLSTPVFDAYKVSFTTFGDKRFEGWLTRPKSANSESRKYPAILIFPGYGDAPAPLPSEYLLEEELQNYVILSLRINAKPVDEPTPEHKPYVFIGLDSRDHYVYRDIYASTVRATRFLKQAEYVNPNKIFCLGGSQGGALTLAAAALNPEVAGAISFAPFLCDFPAAVRPEAIWPYDQLRDYLEKHPDQRDQAFETLSYYDVANLSAWVKCPVLFGIGLQDKICPPETTIVAYNRIPGTKILRLYGLAGHGGPGRFQSEVYEYFGGLLGSSLGSSRAPEEP